MLWAKELCLQTWDNIIIKQGCFCSNCLKVRPAIKGNFGIWNIGKINKGIMDFFVRNHGVPKRPLESIKGNRDTDLADICQNINSIKPGAPFMGHRQTA